jgi:pimeloyl-ACP methyl ester carboxylesterase
VLLAAQRPDTVSSPAFVQLRRNLLADLAKTYQMTPRPVDSGHNVHRERPEVVAGAVREVLEARAR